MSQSVLCAGTIFDVAKRRRAILGTSLNAKVTSEMNGNVSTIQHRSFGYYGTWRLDQYGALLMQVEQCFCIQGQLCACCTCVKLSEFIEIIGTEL